MKKLIFPLILFTLLSCSFTREYTRPKPPIPDTWRDAHMSRESRTGTFVKDVTVYDVVRDERLKRLINMALENNRDIKISASNVERARAYFGVRQAELLPSLNLIAEEIRQRIPSDLSPKGEAKISEQYSISGGIVSWELDIFGRIRASASAALESYLAQKEISRGVRLSLISEIAAAYFTYAADKEISEIAKEILRINEQIYEIVRARFESGMASQVDLKYAETQVENAREMYNKYLEQTSKDKNALDLLAGLPVPEELLPEGTGDVVPLLDISPGLSSEVLLTRPDIMSHEHTLKAMNAYIDAARAAFFPTISLTTAIGLASSELSGLFSAGSKAWTFKPQIKMPIFDARIMEAHRLAKVEREIALLNYEKAIQNAFREVSDCLAVKATIMERKKACEKIVSALSDALRLSKIRYEKGIDNYLSLLNAQKAFLSAKINEVQLELLKNTNLLTLYKALGGGRGE
ncbi:MAG: efflux transporter outer membrane subunit [candidate division WOR-3 bacterium]